MGDWDWAAIEFWFIVIQFIVLGVGGLIARSIRANSERITRLRLDVDAHDERLERELGAHAERLARLEAAQVTHEDLSRIYERLDFNATGLAEVKGTLTAVHGTLQTIQQHLLDRAAP